MSNKNFPEQGFSSHQVCTLVAEAVLKDREINGSTLASFPKVLFGHDETGFWLKLRAHGVETPPQVFEAAQLREAVDRWQQGLEFGRGFFVAVQDMLVRLEEAVSASKQGGW